MGLTKFSVGMLEIEEIEDGLYRIVDPMGFMSYALAGTETLAVIDTMIGIGDLHFVVEELKKHHVCKDIKVFLTHRHPDHVGHAFAFDMVWMPKGEDEHWEKSRKQILEHKRALAQVPDRYLRNATVDLWPAEYRDVPEVIHIHEGQSFDLGGKSLQPISVPGHTEASMSYLCPELKCLFSGDALTPIMCLCFEESLSVADWLKTLNKLQTLPFENFYTGHHRHRFTKEDIPSFIEAAKFSEHDRGFEWQHAYVADWKGVCHLCPSPTQDIDSPDFRAVITKA